MEQDWRRRVIGERRKMLQQPALRRAQVVRVRNQISVDPPRREGPFGVKLRKNEISAELCEWSREFGEMPRDIR